MRLSNPFFNVFAFRVKLDGFMCQTFFPTAAAYKLGHEHGVAAVFNEGDPRPPRNPLMAEQYMQGWNSGLRQGRSEAQFEAQEQAFHDWENRL